MTTNCTIRTPRAGDYAGLDKPGGWRVVCNRRFPGDREANRVYILRPDLLPHPRARTPQQQEQEQNLRYVAFTRVKQALTFVGGPAPQPARAGQPAAMVGSHAE